MTKDLLLSLAAAYLTAIFLLPTLINTNVFKKIPLPYVFLFIAFPAVVLTGMLVAKLLGKKIAVFWQLAKFGLVGVLNTAIDFGILNLLISLTQVVSGPFIIVMNATSFSAAVVNSYYWNKEWVFSGSKKSSFLVFAVVSVVGIAINSGIVFALTTFVKPVFVSSPELWANLAKVLATVLSLVWNFLGYKLIVFKKE